MSDVFHTPNFTTAYRRLMLRVHPDKLASLELSEPWLAGARLLAHLYSRAHSVLTQASSAGAAASESSPLLTLTLTRTDGFPFPPRAQEGGEFYLLSRESKTRKGFVLAPDAAYVSLPVCKQVRVPPFLSFAIIFPAITQLPITPPSGTLGCFSFCVLVGYGRLAQWPQL